MTGWLTEWCGEWNAGLSEEQVLHVRWMVNPDSRPLRNVQLVICDGQLTDIIQMPDHLAFQARPLAMIPQLVNAHTHLEFSGLQSPLLPAEPFTEWIRAVIRYRNSSIRSNSQPQQIRQGLLESQHSGVRGIGEISTIDDSLPACPRPSQVVSFRECIGLAPQEIDIQLALAGGHILRQRANSSLPGISPHAPYSVHPDLLDQLVSLACREDVPLAMHLAETADEIQLLHSGTGRFRDFLSSLGLWNDRLFPGGRSPLDYLEVLARAPRGLVVHGNYLSPRELGFVKSHPQLTTVYCPRTHRFFGHSVHPWTELLEADAPVALGTDSRASNPDLGIWKELQYAAAQTDRISAARLLSMVTTIAAEALGLNPRHFTVQSGRPLNCVLLNCSDQAAHSAEALFREIEHQPVAVMESGYIHCV